MIASMNRTVGDAIAAMLIQGVSAAIMSVIFRAAERAFGDDDLSACTFPGLYLAIELPSAFLFLGNRVTGLQIWVLVLIQESWSVFRNSGLWYMAYNKVRREGRACRGSSHLLTLTPRRRC